MGSCYSGEHIAGDHIHTDRPAFNTEEPQQKYSLGTVNKRLIEGVGRGVGVGVEEGLNMFYCAQTSPMYAMFAEKREIPYDVNKASGQCTNEQITFMK